MKTTYKEAGVNKEAGYETVNKIQDAVKSTYNSQVLGELGGFSGAFMPNLEGIKEPVLVSGTDGVGTKLKIAFKLDKHDTIGIDCVAMCVNDILCQGAKPLFFLDYIAVGKLNPNQVTCIVEGIAEGCRQAGAALIGGETAEMPGFYQVGEYDVAGFVVGIVDKDKMLGSHLVEEGDTLIGLPSSGFHSNGFSLIRHILEKQNREDLYKDLLTPTKIYVNDVMPLIKQNLVHACAHITGGGFIENIPRLLPNGLRAILNLKDYEVPSLFRKIQDLGDIEELEMFGTFNMGIGFVLAVSNNNVDLVLKQCKDSIILGKIVKGEKGVDLCLE